MAATMLMIIGPPAVGKMSVGHEIAVRTGLGLFHNHLAIEPALRFFPFGSPPFARLVEGFRSSLIEEVAASDSPGMIMTYVWAFDAPEDATTVDAYTEPFRRRGARVLFLELHATQQERLRRNSGEFRLAEKASKRDLARSEQQLLAMDSQHRLHSAGEFDGRDDYLRIDNTALSPAEVAEQTIAHFGL